MRYFLISISTIFISCGSYPKKKHFEPVDQVKTQIVNPYFSDGTKDYIYKADISFFKKNFSGICILKKLGEIQHRVVFTTEMGTKIFDFSISQDDFQINYILPEMDKKMVITKLKEDFRVLTKENPLCSATYIKNKQTLFECQINKSKYYYQSVGARLNKIVKSKNGTEKVSFLFSNVTDHKANLIKIVHKSLDLIILLKAI